MQKFLSFLIVFFSFAFLSAGWGADLCEDVTCSGHGECQEDGEDEWCVCDEGYIADGLNCILGCNGVTCSGHGTCSVVSGAEVCTCEAGFHASGLNCILNEASTVDTLAILNGNDCYNTGNCHYRLIFATGAYSFTPSIASLYDIIVNVLDSENVWHNYRKTVAQCVTEGVCDNVDAQYIDFWFQHEVNGNQYITVEVLGNGDDACDDMYHDVLIDYCYGVDCGTGGSCDDSLGYPVCSCDYGYVLRNNYCEEGWFEDVNLAAAVVELLQYEGYEIETETDIDPEMLENITRLPLKGRNISSLSGIELFSSLGFLDVSENSITDLSPLAECEGLQVLNISGNPVNDLSPLGGLPVYSIDISYSGVYNLNPLVSVSTLEEIVLADTENGLYSMVRPDGITVQVWLGNSPLWGCNGIIEYGDQGVRFGEIERDSGCPSHGSCVAGKCVCDAGYVYSAVSNTCFNPASCGDGTHTDINSGNCESDIRKYNCGELPEHSEISSDNRIRWDGSGYPVPAGKTTDLCYNEEAGCADSICQWKCRLGYRHVKDDICAPAAERKIPAGAWNQLILPGISRQDVVLEPVPGVPSFAPVLKAAIYYDEFDLLAAGWHLDLPRVELQRDSFGFIAPLYSWDQKSVYVYMPWGKEEYSIVSEKKCYNFDDTSVPCGDLHDMSGISKVKITFYPAPGQNLFSYIVLETSGIASEISYSNNGTYFDHSRVSDNWKITRYGDDGSVTEFLRNYDEENRPVFQAPRPALYKFMDYIPVSKHITRDQKETSFSYLWERSETADGKYSHYNIRSATIVDPLQRVIKITSSSPKRQDNEIPWFGLMGSPDNSYAAVSRPLEGDIEIYTGTAAASEPLKKVAGYSFHQGGFDMEASIYRNGNLYRQDSYERRGNTFFLSSNSSGRTEWSVTRGGYTEKKLVGTSSEYIVREVGGTFYKSRQKINGTYYSLSLPAGEEDRHKIITVYSHKESGDPVEERISEEYFTGWIQPAKRVTCSYNTGGNCDNAADSVTEEIKYNVSGSPVYFRNAYGQVRVNLYDITSETNAENYHFHFYNDPGTYNNYDSGAYSISPNFIRADNLHKSGTLACSALYSLDANEEDINSMLSQYVSEGIVPNSDWCSNGSGRRVTNYEWRREYWEKPYDLKTVTYPDGKTKTFTYDYDISSFFQNAPSQSLYSYYTPNGKVWGETVTGSSNQNTLQTCYAYAVNYQLMAQGTGTAGNCNYKKGFAFDSSGLLMTRDFSYNGNAETLSNDYIYDKTGRKLVEKNSAGVSTLYVYDSLDRVVFTFFGCRLNNNNNSVAFGRIYGPYDFDGDDSAGDDGRGVTFLSDFPYNDFTCEYYRKYKYDEMSNLVETDFFEYWGVNANNQIVKDATNPKIIKQTTVYDKIGRAIKSCQFDVAQPSDKRCIETEHDIFGNIVKKEETVYDQNDLKRNDVQGEVREITYDIRNRPLTVTVDGVQTEEYSYSNSTSNGYFGYDSIANKYENIDPLITYKDKWNRAAKQTDPFGNNVEPHYNSTTWLTDYSKTYNGTTLTGFNAYEYDDLGRVSIIKKVLFDPASNTSNAAATSINSIAAKEMVLEKSYSYDSNTGSVVSVSDSFGRETLNEYDNLNRIVKVENHDADNLLVSSERTAYDTTGRISAVQNWNSAKTTVTEYDYDNMGRVIATCVSTANAAETDDCLANSCTLTDTKCSYQLYNTGGQVVWSADTERGEITNLLPFLNMSLFVGNETVYSYNAFGEVVKTARRMTANGSGGGYKETQLYNSDGWITTNYTYDIFGRNTEKTDDNGAKTYYTYTVNNLPATEKYCGSGDSNCRFPREVTYTYNTLRDLVSETYEQNNVSLTVNYGRDDFGRISQKYTGTTANDVYQTFTYNNRNLLETAKSVDPTDVSSTLSEVTRTYDSFGNIKSETFDSGTVSSAISWNSSTKVMTETTTLPTGKNIVETAFSGLPKALEYDGTKLLQYNYGSGNVLSSIHKNFDANNNHAAELDYTYNDWRKVSRRKEDFTSLNAPTVADYEYTYSKGLHLIGKQENTENRRTAYQYDSYYRLRRVDYDCDYSSSDPTCANNRNNVFKCNQSETDCEDFQLDGVHNIRSSYENQTNFAWTVDGFNRLTQKSDGSNTVKYSYDSNNNMIGEDLDGDNNPEIVYTYDKLNRLTSVANSDYLVEYSYDPFNRRTEKTVYYADGNDTYEQTHKYAYNDWDIISEEIKTVRTSDTPVTTTAWEIRRYVDHGTDNHIIMDTVSCSDDGNGNCSPNESTLQRIWFHKDERGNIIAISDGNGTIYERYRYRGYGEHEVLNADFTPKTTAAISPFLWGGSLYEPETNLYWMRNRYYHIDMHRFINQDPIGIWGDANNLGNGFAYVAGMVIEASDPSGLDLVITVVRYKYDDDVIYSVIFLESTDYPEEVNGKVFYGLERNNGKDVNAMPAGVYRRDTKFREDGRVKFRVEYTKRNHQVHVGNYPWDSDGCVLPGTHFSPISKADRISEINKYEKDKRKKELAEDLKFKTAVRNSRSVMNLIQNVAYDGNGKPVRTTVIIEDPFEFVSPDDGQVNKQEEPILPTPEKTSDDEVTWTETLTTVWPNDSVVECEFGSCHCVLNCAGTGSGNIPSDPGEDPSNAIQKVLMNNILAKMLKRGESEQLPFFVDTSTGPNGAIIIYKNPYYVNKDPLKTILFDGNNGSGKPMIYRNPFVPGAGYGYDATTYEQWQQSGFPQTNVDPYWY